MRTSTSTSLLLLALLPACGRAALDDYHDALDARDTEGSSTTGDASSSTWPGSMTSTVTTAPPSETEGDASTAGDTDGTGEAVTMGDDPPGPPLIVGDPVLDPNPIKVGGLITVTALTQDADAVTMKTLDDGEEVALAPGVTPGTFVGQLEAFTGLENGSHEIVLTPTRSGEPGDAVPVSYTIELPEPGTEGFWEAGDLIGPGEVAAIGMLPNKSLIELGSRTVQGKSACYLRRRDPSGGWALSDVVDLLPGVECEAVDMKIASEGEGPIFALLRRQTNSGLVWWLIELPTAPWGAEPKTRGLGAVGEQVYALAERHGTVAVCGTAPTQHIDEMDVLINVFRPNLPGERAVVDYVPDPQQPDHLFRETGRDCVFAGDETLAVVGDAYGIHGNQGPYRSRRFTLTLDLSGGQEPEWSLPPPQFLTQSVANAVDVDDHGELVQVGYVCDDICEPEGWIWMDGAESPLGKVPADYLAPSDVRWDPAGFAVVASAGEDKDLWAFTVRAFYADASLAWAYMRKDPPQIHLSRVVSIGAFGEVWVGGWGANGYPAVANVHR